jgi:hypothetical protein
MTKQLMTESRARVWAIICELSDDDWRRERAAALLGKLPREVDAERGRRLTQTILEIWRDPIAGPQLRGIVRRSGGNLKWFEEELTRVGVPRPRQKALREMATRSGSDLPKFLKELAEARLEMQAARFTGEADVVEPPRSGPKDKRAVDYLADNVARAYQWLTDQPPPASNFYDRPELLEHAYYRLGKVVFESHGVVWRARRMMLAASRARRQK